MPPQGFHAVRSHIRRNPRPASKKMSGWMIAALIGGVWLWNQVFGFGESKAEQTPSPKPSVSAPAER